MPRKVRIEYPGAVYHVINRGDRREDIFKDDLDRPGRARDNQGERGRTPRMGATDGTTTAGGGVSGI